MGYLEKNKEVHAIAHHQIANWAVRGWASWYCASELMRRHPGTFRPVDRFVMQKELLDLETTGEENQVMIRINRIGSITVWGQRNHKSDCRMEFGAKKDDQISILDLTSTANPREIILDVEECAGYRAPSVTPETVTNTIGPRVIAELLRSRLHTARPLYAQGIFQSSEYGDEIEQSHVNGFHGLEELAKMEFITRWQSINDQPVPRFSPLFMITEGRISGGVEDLEARKPLFIVDIEKGLVHTRSQTVSLLSAYRQNKGSIEFTAAKLLFELI
jgi:hypothetical protein